jgi:hypothetical protein
MSNSVHGDIKEITYNHPTIGSGRFRPKSGEGNTYNTGGLVNSDDTNAISSNGDLIMTKNRVRGMFEAVIVNSTAAGEDSDSEIVRQLQESPVAADWTFTTMADAVFAGSGWPVGEIAPDLNAGTFTLKVVSGQLNKIA